MEPRTTPIPLWRATRGARVITCNLVAWPHGVDLRAFVDGELYRTQLCRDLDEWSRVQAAWRAALEADGWATSPGVEGSKPDGAPGG